MYSSLQDLQQIFEYELKRKLSERAKSSSGEMRVLLNGFKFFDINYTGIINKSQWIQGILRTGLTGFSENDLDSLFILYDRNNTGQIDYKNFCSFLYGREPLNPLTNNSQSLKIEQNNNEDLIQENNNQEMEMNLNNQNKQYNQNNNYNQYNTPNQNYKRNYNNIIFGERNYINNDNNNIFNNNIDNNQRKPSNSSKNYFNNNQNDNFGYNKRTPIDNYEYQENTNFRKSQRKINSYKSTFNNIFQQDSIQSNNKKINNCNLSESAINSIIISIRNNININNGIKLFTFIKNLKKRELNNSQISINDLYNLFQDMRINIPYNEIKILFNYTNKNDSDIIPTEQLINIIKGTLEEQRKLYIVEVFSNLDKEQTGKVQIDTLKNLFNAKKHPEVINGTKSQEEVFEQFCNSLDLYCEISNIPKNGELSFENFVDYYTGISASIPDEVYFEDMINGVWNNINNINNKNNQETNYSNNNINNNNCSSNDTNMKYNMNSILMGISPNDRNNNQNNGTNNRNNFNNNYKYNNKYNNMIQMECNVEKKMKNSMSSPFIYDNDVNNNQMNNYNNYRNANNNNNILNNNNNNAQYPFINYSNNRNNHNKSKISVPKGIDNYQNKNKKRYNPILDEYYPEITNSNQNNQNQNDNIVTSKNNNLNNLQNNNYRRNQIQHNNNFNILNNNIINDENTTKESSNISNITNEQSNPIIQLRNILISRGPKTIFTFQRMLTIYDRNNSGLISLEDFLNIFQLYNISLPDSEIQNIFNIYNQNNAEAINYSSLINDLIGEMNERRNLLVANVFNNFNKNENGEVSLKEIKQRFNPTNHPDVINRRKDSNEVYGEFLDILEIYREYVNNLKGGFINTINFEDFKQFYGEISMSIKDDNVFENMMKNCWNIGGNSGGYNKNNNRNNNDFNCNIRARTGQQIMNTKNRGY